jgi:hypothetical protein
MKIFRFSYKNDAKWQWIYHLLLAAFGLIGILIVWLSNFSGEN